MMEMLDVYQFIFIFGEGVFNECFLENVMIYCFYYFFMF